MQSQLTIQISRNAGGEKTTRRYSERAAEIDHARQSAAMEDVEAVLSVAQQVAISTLHTSTSDIGQWQHNVTYRVLFLNVKLEVDGARTSGGYAELQFERPQ